MSDELVLWLIGSLFAATYVALAIGRIPGLRMDRAGIALVGATLMLVSGVVSFPQAVSPETIDYKTLAVLFGMMVVVGFVRLSGLLERLTRPAVEHGHIGRWGWLQARPIGLLSLVAAALSNLVSNVPAVLVMGPLLKPVPESGRETAWLALAMSSTLAGNLTVLGSVANLIVLENGRRPGLSRHRQESPESHRICKLAVRVPSLPRLLGPTFGPLRQPRPLG